MALRRRYADADLLVRQGDEGASLFILETGRAATRLLSAGGNDMTLSVMGPGDVFGELGAVLPVHERTATVRAIGQVTALVLRRADIDRLRAEHPQVNDFLLQLLAQRVDRLSRRLLEAHHLPVDNRLARRLLEVGRRFAGGPHPGCSP